MTSSPHFTDHRQLEVLRLQSSMSTGTQDTNAQSMHALPKLEPIDARNESVQNLLTRPHKCILSDLDMLVWERSQAHDCILLFLMHLSEACTGCPTRDIVWDNYTTYSTSKSIVDRVLALLIHWIHGPTKSNHSQALSALEIWPLDRGVLDSLNA